MKKMSQKALSIILMLCMIMSVMVINVSAVVDEEGNTIVTVPVGNTSYSFAWEPEEKNVMNDYFGDTSRFTLDFLRIASLLNYQTCFLYNMQLDGILQLMGFNETEKKSSYYDGKYYDEYTFMTELGYYKNDKGQYTDADGNLILNDNGEPYKDTDVKFDWTTYVSEDKRVLMPDETTYFILASCDIKIGKEDKTIILVLFGASETTGRGLTSLDFFSSNDYTCLNYAKTSAQVVLDNPDFQKLVKDAVDDPETDDFIIWTGGYCRGGACGNYLAAHLNKCTENVTNIDDGTVNSNYKTQYGNQVRFGPSRVIAVDNESMNVTQNPDHTMTNIVNIINPEDLITHLPLGEGYEGWGFGRNGVDLILNTELTNPDMFLAVKDTYNRMSSYNDYSNLGIGIQGLYDALDSIYTMCPEPSDFSNTEQLMYTISNLGSLIGNTEIGTSGTEVPSASDIEALLGSVEIKPYYTTLSHLMTYMFLQTNGSLGVDSEITQILLGTIIKKDLPIANILPGIDSLLPFLGTAESPESEARPLMLFVVDNATEYTIPELLINILIDYRENQTLPTLGTSGKMYSAHMIEASLAWIMTGDTMDDIFQNEDVAELSELDTAMYVLKHVFVFVRGLITDLGGVEEEDPNAPFVYTYEDAYLTVSNANVITSLGFTAPGLTSGSTNQWDWNVPQMKAHVKITAANNPSLTIYEGTVKGTSNYDYTTGTSNGMIFTATGLNSKLSNYNKSIAYKFEIYIVDYNYNGTVHKSTDSVGVTYAAPLAGTPYVTVEGQDITLNLNGVVAIRAPYINQSSSSSSGRRSSFFMMFFGNQFTPIILEGDTGIGTSTVTGTGNYNVSVYGTTSFMVKPVWFRTQTWNLSAYVGN